MCRQLFCLVKFLRKTMDTTNKMDTSLKHHLRNEYCTTRLKYRQGKQLKAVKVYTVANESQNLLIFGVPKINLQQELKQRLLKFGKFYHVRNITADILAKQMDVEQFTEVYWVKYHRIFDARKCKRFLDAKEFYGGILHISYAPEYESKEELKEKLNQRTFEVIKCLKRNESYNKRKREDHSCTKTN